MHLQYSYEYTYSYEYYCALVVDCSGCSSGDRLLTNQHTRIARCMHSYASYFTPHQKCVLECTEGAEGAPSEPAAAEGAAAAPAEAAVGAVVGGGDGGGGGGAGSRRPSLHSSGTSPERSTRVRQWAGESSSGEESEGGGDEGGSIGSDQLALATLERLNAHARRIATSVLDQYGAGNDLQSDIKA